MSQLRQAWRHTPYTLCLSIALTGVGALALALGDGVSRALSEIAAHIVTRAMGASMVTGGIISLLGVLGRRTLLETLGLALMAAGLGIYGLGVLLGLGLQGAVAGPICLALVVATLRRIATITSAARTLLDR